MSFASTVTALSPTVQTSKLSLPLRHPASAACPKLSTVYAFVVNSGLLSSTGSTLILNWTMSDMSDVQPTLHGNSPPETVDSAVIWTM